MGSIDDYKYPDLSADDAVEIADILVNDFGGDPNSEEAFAQSIGHSTADSGAYRQKLADCRRWGILPSRGVQATQLAFDIANPRDEAHGRELKFQMFQNIELLEHLYDHLEGQSPPSEFWRILTEVSDANPKEARNAADDVLVLYREMLRCEPKDESKDSENQTDNETEVAENQQHRASEVPEAGIFLQIGNDTLRLEEVTPMHLELARTMLDQKERMLGQHNSEALSSPSEPVSEEEETSTGK